MRGICLYIVHTIIGTNSLGRTDGAELEEPRFCRHLFSSCSIFIWDWVGGTGCSRYFLYGEVLH